MIVVRIWEGLGNQLFQYAYAKTLQLEINKPVFIQNNYPAKGSFGNEESDGMDRKYQLSNYNISLETISIPENELLEIDNNKWIIINDANRECDYLHELIDIKDFTFVNAHCINKAYFNKNRDVLLKEFSLKNIPIIDNRLNNILNGDSAISIHVRLTDYLGSDYYVCEKLYYKVAVEYMQEMVPDAFFLIFSDDVDTARKMYEFPRNAIWVSELGYRDYEELWMMTKCKHHIMAGSTYSFWGTWLSDYKSGITIAPKRWLVNNLYEKEWKVL